MFGFKRGPTLGEADPKTLDIETLSFQHSALIAKLIQVNEELLRRISSVGPLAKQVEAASKEAAVLDQRAGTLKGFGVLLKEMLRQNKAAP